MDWIGLLLSLMKGTQFYAYLAVAGLIAIIFAFFKGESVGRATAEAAQAAKERHDVDAVNRARAKARAMTDEELKKALEKWTIR